MEIIIDGKMISNRQQFYQVLKENLNTVDFYGNNLDALWDVLSTKDDEITIKIINCDDLFANLGDYAKHLIETLKEVIKINKKFTLLICK